MRPPITSRTARVAQSVLLFVLLTLLAGCATPLVHVVAVPPAPERSHLVAKPPLTFLPVRAELEAAPTSAATVDALFEAPPASRTTLDDDAPTCPAPGTRLLLIGDSLSHGLAPHLMKHAQACGTPYFHRGVIGSHVTQWAHPSWLQPELRRAQPTVVLVSLGGNDFQRHDVEKVRAGIETFVTAVHGSGAELLWISPPTMPFADTAGVRGMWADAIARHDVPSFAAHALELPRVSDRIHPTRAGHVELARLLWGWVVRESP